MPDPQHSDFLYGGPSGADNPAAINVQNADEPLLQPEVMQAFTNLQAKAEPEGFDLQIASGYRSFTRQLTIWNRKARGERPILDTMGKPLDISGLSETEIVFAILRFSALPGASRHHWGTDCDVFDNNAMPDGYQLQLSPEEVADSGIFGPLHIWLDRQIREDAAFDFFRPYHSDRGGVAPERWHLSYAPLARQYQQDFSVAQLRSRIEHSDIELKSAILDNLDEIFRRFIHVPFSSYPEPVQEW